MNYTEVQTALERVVRVNGGSAYVGAVNSSVEDALVSLAITAGVPRHVVADLSSNQLVNIYQTARKNLPALTGLIRELNKQYGDGPVIDQYPYTPPTPPKYAPKPDPKEQFGALKSDVPAIVEKVVERIEPRLTELAGNIQSQYDAMAGEVRNDAKSIATEIARKIVEESRPTNLIVTLPDQAPKPIGVVHFQTARIITLLSRGDHVYLHGPAGSGKTSCASKVAEAFGLLLYTVAKVESEYLLLGFRDARGEAVRTPFREAYEHGGVFLFDELDGSSPGAIVALNMALANGMCPFPDGTIKMHKDFKCIAAGNTTGRGADRQYVGRSQLDAASLDRFAFVNFPYDDALEGAIAPHQGWLDFVRAIRKLVSDRQLPHIVTPRATIAGGKAILAGECWKEAAETYIWKGLDPDTVEAIYSAIPSEVTEALVIKPDPFAGIELI